MPPHRSGRRRRRDHESGEESSRSSCQEDKEHEAKPASSQTQSEALDQVSELSGRCQYSTPVSCVWDPLWREWGRAFCIRLDLRGCYHTYPDVGGPFQSLQETYEAIDRYLEDLRDPKMCVEQDKAIRRRLYWLDGTIKRRTISSITEKSEMCQVVQALVDKRNEDHNLFEGLAHGVKDVLYYKSICQCYRCTRNEDVGMKHPSSSGYTAGHLKVGMPCGYFAKWKSDYEDEEDDDKYVKAREAELRQMFKGLDKPGVMEKLCTPPPWATKRKKLE